jgi:hypothetical protein
MRRGAAETVWTNRRETGASASQTGAPKPDNVSAVGGGFFPTLSMGGGAGVSGRSRLVWGAGS